MKKKYVIALIMAVLLSSCSNWRWSFARGLESEGDWTGNEYRVKYRPWEKGVWINEDKEEVE